jgi:ribonucleoside-diphosphate reductase alpha chain
MRRIAEDQGSVQAEDWLSKHEKEVFKTAFEVNQEYILRMTSQRQPDICQSQSMNLYFTAEEEEEEIVRLHDIAFRDENILSMYYI